VAEDIRTTNYLDPLNHETKQRIQLMCVSPKPGILLAVGFSNFDGDQKKNRMYWRIKAKYCFCKDSERNPKKVFRLISLRFDSLMS